MIIKKLLLISLCFISFALLGQNKNTDMDVIIQEIFEQYAAESEESLDFESFYADLMHFADAPLALNTATVDDLNLLPFLSDAQIESILAYIYRFGSLQSVYELQLISGLDMTDIRRVLPFITIANTENITSKYYFKDYLTQGKNTLFIRTDKTIEKQRGFNSVELSHYTGSAFYNSLKYSYAFKNKLIFGFTAEKDAGEPYWNKLTHSPESFSAHMLVHDLGRLKTLVLGDYRASFGQGLVMNMGFGSRKSSYVTQIMQRDNGLKKFSSTDEYSFLRGAGVTFSIKNISITGFCSSKKMDADTSAGSIKSIYTMGLHRTESEIQKSNTLTQNVIGANIVWRSNYARFGVTGVYTSFSDSILPDVEAYSMYNFRGKKQSTVGADYRIRLAPFNLFGEVGVTNQQAIATVHGCSFSPTSTATLVALFRYYSPEYNAIFANAFGENTRITNESGFYTGAEIRPFKKWKFSLYADSYRFPWLRFGVNSPGVGQDYLLQADYSLSRSIQISGRVKYEQKAQNAVVGTIQLPYDYGKASFRYQLNYVSGNLKSTNRIELTCADSTQSVFRWGFAAYQEISYEFRKFPLHIDVRCLFFDAPNYDNRMYMYEKDVLYAFSLPVLYGQGMRYYLNLQYNPLPQLTVWLKLAQTTYHPDRTSIGSGLDEISGNRKTDLRLQLRYSF